MKINRQLKTTAKIEIDLCTLCRLLQNQQMCASEVRCLDNQSKQLLWKTCLHTCLEKTGSR